VEELYGDFDYQPLDEASIDMVWVAQLFTGRPAV
jgi:hypothetical protein